MPKKYKSFRQKVADDKTSVDRDAERLKICDKALKHQTYPKNLSGLVVDVLLILIK
ncbi:hypothetical protein [Microseira sp. BLCC-F43]|jgi:hypothetical protein|uniref:hypothetical protein n=1 Tax=Microseira sp. BLCC-F43 TaxID=3153602 RepID=UPI0035B9B402